MFEHLPRVSESDFDTFIDASGARIGLREIAENMEGYLRELKEHNPWLGKAVEASAEIIADVDGRGYVPTVMVDALTGFLAVLRLVDRRLEQAELDKL